MARADQPHHAPSDARLGWAGAAWCVTAAFGTYFCVYGFRKPFAAAAYPDPVVWGVGYKTALVVAQVLGYALSKFVGIKVVAEAPPHRRAGLLLALVAAAEAALVLFALTPPPLNLVWLFCNGVPLGMVFGLVLGFLEGRRQTEALAAGLCGSFILADGVVKSAGAALLRAGVSEAWMPAAAGLLFAPPLVLFTGMLARVPPPTPLDVAARGERGPMGRAERGALFRRYAPGLVLLMLAYLLVTVLRSVRADFAPEIWAGLLGAAAPPATYSWSELAVAAGATAAVGAAVLVRDNRRAFFAGLGVAALGAGLLVAALAARGRGHLSPFGFMVLGGIGLYLPYIAVHTVLFERLMAVTRDRGNIAYLMHLVDSVGYLGYVGVLVGRHRLAPADDFAGFFLTLCGVLGTACVVLLGLCGAYFWRHPATRRPAPG